MFSHRMAAAALEASIKTNSGYSVWPGQEAGRSWGLLVGLVEELLEGGQAWLAGRARCWLPGGRHDLG